LKAAGAPGQLLFVPSYFDYVRLKAFLGEEGAGFADLGEYVPPPDAARARTLFAQGTASGGTDHSLPRLALLTERAHFYHRAVLRGVRDVLVYQPPEHASFWGWVVARAGRAGGHPVQWPGRPGPGAHRGQRAGAAHAEGDRAGVRVLLIESTFLFLLPSC